MVDEMDFLWRPVLRGMVKVESLMDGSIDLCMVAQMNEAMDVEEENQRRSSRG